MLLKGGLITTKQSIYFSAQQVLRSMVPVSLGYTLKHAEAYIVQTYTHVCTAMKLALPTTGADVKYIEVHDSNLPAP